MDNIDAKIANLKNQITNLDVSVFLQEQVVADPDPSTGNPQADAQLRAAADQAAVQIVILKRQMEKRAAMLATLTAVPADGVSVSPAPSPVSSPARTP